MSPARLRYHIALLLGCLPLLPLFAQQKRAFEPGGQESLVLAGSVKQIGSVIEPNVTSMSFTTDRSGKLVMADVKGTGKLDTIPVIVYEAQLFVDEEGVRAALQPFAGEEFDGLQTQGKIQEAVRKGAFAKLLVVRFARPQEARKAREDLAGELRNYPGGSGGEAGRLTGYLRKDFVKGDEVEIRIAPGGIVNATVKGEVQKEIVSPEFADAILSVWLMKSPSSVRGLKSFMSPKSGF